MIIVFKGKFGAAVAEVVGGKVLVLTDENGNQMEAHLSNEAAEIIGKALKPGLSIASNPKDIARLAGRNDNGH